MADDYILLNVIDVDVDDDEKPSDVKCHISNVLRISLNTLYQNVLLNR